MEKWVGLFETPRHPFLPIIVKTTPRQLLVGDELTVLTHVLVLTSKCRFSKSRVRERTWERFALAIFLTEPSDGIHVEVPLPSQFRESLVIRCP